MTPEERVDRLLEEWGEIKAQLTEPKREPPSPWYKRAAPAATAFAGIAGALILIWAFFSDHLIIPRAEADETHRSMGTRIEKVENHAVLQDRAIRQQAAVSTTMDSNVRAIGGKLGVQMDPPPQPDMLPE